MDQCNASKPEATLTGTSERKSCSWERRISLLTFTKSVRQAEKIIH